MCPQLTFSVQDVIVDKNKVAVEWTTQGFQKNGKSYENQMTTILKLHEDKIIYLSSYFKNETRFMSWGVVDR